MSNFSVCQPQSRPCTWRRVETRPRHNSQLRRSQKFSKPPVSSDVIKCHLPVFPSRSEKRADCLAVCSSRWILRALFSPCHVSVRGKQRFCILHRWTNEQCDAVLDRMMKQSMSCWNELNWINPLVMLLWCLCQSLAEQLHCHLHQDDKKLEIDLGVLAACVGELLHKFVLPLVEPCSGVPIMLISMAVEGLSSSELSLTVPNIPLRGMPNHSWQLWKQLCFTICFPVWFCFICVTHCVAMWASTSCFRASNLVVRVCFSFSNCAGCLASNCRLCGFRFQVQPRHLCP